MNYNIIQKKYKGLTFSIREGTSDEKGIIEVIDKNGYERRDFKIIEGEKWLDIGASVGAFSVLASSKKARVISFEPEQGSFELLKINCQQFGNKIMNYGLGKEDCKKILYANSARGNFWRSSVYKKWRGADEQSISILKIDDFIEENINLKIDCEGAEIDILNRLFETGLIKKVNKIVVEWSFDIFPETRLFIDTVNKLSETHNILNLSEKRKSAIEKEPIYPKTWFPPALKLFIVRK